MTVRCEVCGQLPLQGSPRSFFPWPTDSSQRTYWQTCLGLQVVDLNKSDLFICSDHFDSMQMIRKGTALRKDAFPKRYMGPLPIFAPEDESPKIETLLDTTAVKNEDGIFGGAGPSAPIFDDEEIMPEELSMAKLVQMFAAAAKERPPTIVPLVTPIAEETKAFSNILIDRQEKYLNSYCKSCLRQAELVNMLEANCEGVPVSLMYKTVFMSEINGTEVPQMMCATCIGLLFQCFKFSTMTVRSCEVLQAARERFKYLPAIDDGTIDLKNIPQKYSAKSSAIQPVIQSDGEDTKEDITVAKKRKSVVKAKEVPEKKGRRTSSRKASEKAKKVSKKILEESEDEESNDIFDNDDADPDFDTAAYEVKDESPEVSEAEEDNKEGDNTEEDPEDNYCMLCRHSFSNMVRHMDKVHRVDWESKSCERCKYKVVTAKKLFLHIENHEKLKCCSCFLPFGDQKGLDLHMTYSICAWKSPLLRIKRQRKLRLIKSATPRVTIKPNFACASCDFDCDTFKEIFDHFKSDHQDSLVCIICKKSYKNKPYLSAHFKAHARELFCTEHFQAFDSHDQLLAHFKTPEHLQCEICYDTFESALKRDEHKKSHKKPKRWKPPKEEIVCPHCPVIFTNRQNIQKHIWSTHLKRTFMCEVCGKEFTTSYQMRRHLSLKHGKGSVRDFSVQCEICGKNLSNITNFKQHMAAHLGHTEHCGYCKDTFKDKTQLEEHVKATGHMWFSCEKCSWAFKTRTILSRHSLKCGNLKVNRGSFIKPQRLYNGRIGPRKSQYSVIDQNKFVCNFCKKSFTNRGNLYKHVNIHLGVKFACEICGKEFTQKDTLKNHYSVHSNRRSHVCAVCGASYKERTSLSKHRRVHKLESMREALNSVKRRKIERNTESSTTDDGTDSD